MGMGMGRFWSEASATLRQWRQPPEFRIPAPGWPVDVLTALSELAPAEPAPAGLARTEPTDATAEPSGSQALPGGSVVDVATSLWRLRGRVERMDDPPRAVVRHLETAWDALADAGVEIRDHVGDPFDPGLMMSVVAYQPTPGLRRERIIEAVRPGVYLGGRSIQMAEVIVGTPEPAETGADATPAEETGTEETRAR